MGVLVKLIRFCNTHHFFCFLQFVHIFFVSIMEDPRQLKCPKKRVRGTNIFEDCEGKYLRWHKLSQTHTLSSARQRVDYFDKLAPKDNLDFKLKAEYDQAAEWNVGQNGVVQQPKTAWDNEPFPTGPRQLRNKTHKPHKFDPVIELKHPLRTYTLGQCETEGNSKCYQGRCHSEKTHRAYAEKLMGFIPAPHISLTKKKSKKWNPNS